MENGKALQCPLQNFGSGKSYMGLSEEDLPNQWVTSCDCKSYDVS